MDQENKKKIYPEDLPYCFDTIEEAEAAVAKLKDLHGVSSYSIGRTLFVRKHESFLRQLNISDYIKSIGGFEASTL